MKIFSAAQIHQWDQFTIDHEPISSVDLMERAAGACFQWLMKHGYEGKIFDVVCGKGNNGGDGLAIARMLADTGHQVRVYIAEFGHKGTNDFQVNLARLHDTEATIRFISDGSQLQNVTLENVTIDTLFGSGLNRPPEGLNIDLINFINSTTGEIIAIDIPSGMSADQSSISHKIVTANHTLTFAQPKLAFLMRENEEYIGKLQVLDIGLHQAFIDHANTPHILVDHSLVSSLYRPRKQSGHKGTYGHALIAAGSYGKMGAAVLALRACIHSGVGLCTAFIPVAGYEVVQTAVPEVMVITDKNEIDPGKYSCIAVGPGIGTSDEAIAMLDELLRSAKRPMVIDADALNILSANQEWLNRLPANSVLTPHPKEFSRLFGEAANDFERIQSAIANAKKYNVVIVLKGHHTLITDGTTNWFNSTGNPGMGSGGTGDTLTGIITALICQGYKTADAAVLGVYLHGKAGDLVAMEEGMEFLTATTLIAKLGKAFKAVDNG